MSPSRGYIYAIIQKRQTMDQQLIEAYHEELDIRNYFTVIQTESDLSLTLINPNITAETLQFVQNIYSGNHSIRNMQISIIECNNFDDQLLAILAKAIPKSCVSISLDFTGCESLRGEGFIELFEQLDGIALTTFKLQIGSVFNINDIVFEGLCLFLSNLPGLKELYLDFYQIDQITEEGYLLLAETLSQMQALTHLHLDLSANENISEDALQILFVGLCRQLTSFCFKILDVGHIGGGSIFKLAEALTEMERLEDLELTISSFSNINQKSIQALLMSMQKAVKLTKLKLNLSNLDLPEKTITLLPFSPKLTEVVLDISCNRRVTDRDMLNLSSKLKSMSKIDLNLDFCSSISEEAIEELVEMVSSQGKCTSFVLRDRNYSENFLNFAAQKLSPMTSLMKLEVGGKISSKKMDALMAILREKQILLSVCLARQRKHQNRMVTNQILELLFCRK